MHRFAVALLVVVSLAFGTSVLAGVGAQLTGVSQFASSDTRLLPMMLTPSRGALGLLLIAVLGAVALHAGRAMFDSGANGADLAPMTVALAAGAALPIAWQQGAVSGFAAALVMMLGAMIAMVRGYLQRANGTGRLHVIRLNTVGLFAGWALIAGFAGFSDLLTVHLDLMQDLAVIVALVLAVGTAMAVQSHIGGAPSFSVAVIWALLGLAAAGLQTGSVLAPVAVLGIAAMTLVLVRAAT